MITSLGPVNHTRTVQSIWRAGQSAKLNAEMLLLNQKVKARKQTFGVDVYTYLQGCVDNDPTLLMNSESGPLQHVHDLFMSACRDYKALVQKQATYRQQQESIQEERRCVKSRHGGTLSYDIPADTVGERILQAPKLAKLRAEETKVQGNIVSVQQQTLAVQQQFGIEVYTRFKTLEQTDMEFTEPKDPQVRKLYAELKQDIALYEKQFNEKAED